MIPITRNMHKRLLSLDIETRSDVDLPKHGVYNYVNTPHFRLLWLSYSYDYGPVQTIDLYHNQLPEFIINDLQDPEVIKCAANATFERICFSRVLGVYLDPTQWTCTLVLAGRNGLPMHLEGAAHHSGVAIQKDGAGKDLIMTFSVPQEISKKNPWRQWINPHHEPEKWAHYGRYNNQDVGAEMAVKHANMYIPISRAEDMLYTLDQRINDRGIKIDRQLVQQAMAMGSRFKAEITQRVIDLTGIKNPNSVQQLVKWLNEETDLEKMAKLPGKTVQKLVDSLDKQINETDQIYLPNETVGKLLVKTPPHIIKEVLECRLMLGKASISKYTAMNKVVGWDDRIRGTLRFYGASRTGRWAGGAGVQPQNMTKHKTSKLDELRLAIRSGDMELVRGMEPNVASALSQCIRTAFIADPEHHFLISDYAAIEARVIAWLAGEQWLLDFFYRGGDIYIETAGRMYKVDPKTIDKKTYEGAQMRARGKVSTLACIAEGSLVLTDIGLIPIEKVSADRKVWDGLHWVTQEGAIFKGIKKVIEYEGLKATEDHLVWIKGESNPIPFGVAAARGAQLLQTGDSGINLRVGDDNFASQAVVKKLEYGLCVRKVQRMRKRKLGQFKLFASRHLERLSTVLTTPTSSYLADQETYSSKTAMREPRRCRLSIVRSQRNRVSIRVGFRGRSICNERSKKLFERLGARSIRQRRALRARESEIRYEKNESSQSQTNKSSVLESRRMALRIHSRTAQASRRVNQRSDYRRSPTSRNQQKEKLARDCGEVKVYDLVNAGPLNRFTASNCLVHNCGYGGSVGALKAMGESLGMIIPEHERQPIVDAWRDAHPNIVDFWGDMERAAIRAIVQPGQFIIAGKLQKLQFVFKRNNLYMILPSGRWLTYQKAYIGTNKFGKPGIFYYESKNSGWLQVDTWGGKLAENATQAVARDLLAGGMLRLDYHGFKIVLHVHDEVVIEEPVNGRTIEEVNHWMCQKSAWYQDLPFEASGFVSPYYKKDDN